MEWPEWWDWEIEVTSHCVKRMADRGFNESDLRTMLHDAARLEEQFQGTFLVDSVLEGEPWTVIVRPDRATQTVLIVTAFRKG